MIEYVVEETGEIRREKAGGLLTEFELRRGLLWLNRGKPDGHGGLIWPHNPDWLRTGGFFTDWRRLEGAAERAS
jgi:hypothetical protein